VGEPPREPARWSIATQDGAGALERLQAAQRKQPDWHEQAVFHNLMGFALRHHTPVDMEAVFRH
jgi:hypothetical protein